MLVERRRSVLPVEFLSRVALAWAFVVGVVVTVNWPDVSNSLTLSLEAGSQVLLPLVTLGCAMMLVSRIAWRLMGDEEASLAALIPALSIPVLFELAPLRLDHNGWQIICALGAVNALMSRNPAIGGWIIGGICAAWLAISAEGLPFTLAMAGVLAWRWLRNHKERAWLVSASQALTGASAVLFVTVQVFGEAAATSGNIDLVSLVLFAWVTAAITVLARFEPIPDGIRVAGFAAIAAGGFGILWLLEVQWSPGVWMPIWDQSILTILQVAVTPIIGIIAVVGLAGSTYDWLSRYWTEYALVLITAFGFGMFYVPAGAVACALAAPPLAWMVHSWLRRIRLMDNLGTRIASSAIVAWALLPALPVIVIAGVLQA